MVALDRLLILGKAWSLLSVIMIVLTFSLPINIPYSCRYSIPYASFIAMLLARGSSRMPRRSDKYWCNVSPCSSSITM